MEKAYKLLAKQQNISNNAAKELIDNGLVMMGNKRLDIARIEVPNNTKFTIQKIQSPKIIFKDDNILCVDKPAFFESYDLEKVFTDWVLLNRLDKETSGVILLVKPESEFAKKAKEEFKKQKVYKLYNALVSGIVSEETTINLPILTSKGNKAKSKINKNGKEAITIIRPLSIIGKKTLLEVEIITGRTHQIRVHLQALNHPIVGDKLYGGIEATRLMLHAKKIKIFDYEFESNLDFLE